MLLIMTKLIIWVLLPFWQLQKRQFVLWMTLRTHPEITSTYRLENPGKIRISFLANYSGKDKTLSRVSSEETLNLFGVKCAV